MGATVIVSTANASCDDEGPAGYGFWPWLTLAIVVLALSVVGAFLIIRKKCPGSPCEDDAHTPPLPTPPQPISSSSIVETTTPPPIVAWPCPPEASDGVSQDWREFVVERLDELNPQQNKDETKWALGIVDFLDELKESDLEASSAGRDISASLGHKLVDILSSKGFTVVDSETWNPDLQRAVAVVRKPDATETIILGKGATGLSRNGKIIRKQEVKIEMKGD